MPDIFDEVDEDLRAERARRVLRRYGGLMIAAVIAVVLAVGGWKVWQGVQQRRLLADASAYLEAVPKLAATDPATRQAGLQTLDQLAGRGHAGYRTLAALRQAAALADAGDVAGAGAIWNRVAADGAADPLLRDLANLQWALHNLDAGDPASVAARLDPLLPQNSPWHGVAGEARALLSLRQGKTEEARGTLRLLVQDLSVPPGVRRRADALLQQIGDPSKAAS